MKIASSGTLNLLRSYFLPGFGPKRLLQIAPLCLTAPEDFKFEETLGVSHAAWNQACEQADRQIQQSAHFDARIISILDSDYPALLKAAPEHPPLLFVQGRLAPNPSKSLAVIGTRSPTQHGRLMAERIASHFASTGWSIISGLALGCDTAAHEGALAAGGHTVAVLAHGLQQITPSQNTKLAHRILDAGGALVSEFPFGLPPQRSLYVARDKTQAGMSQGVILIQSTLDGGSLHASRAAIRYDRWLAVAYPTKRDRDDGVSSIAANLVLSDTFNDQKIQLLLPRATDSEKSQLFRRGALNNILVLKSRDDYHLIEQFPAASFVQPSLPAPHSLF